MRLVRVGKLYLNMDGGLSVRDADVCLFVGSTEQLAHADEKDACPYISDKENVTDFRAWLDRNSDDITKRGGIGPQTTASVRQG